MLCTTTFPYAESRGASTTSRESSGDTSLIGESVVSSSIRKSIENSRNETDVLCCYRQGMGQKLAKRAVGLMPVLSPTSHQASDICYLQKRK